MISNLNKTIKSSNYVAVNKTIKGFLKYFIIFAILYITNYSTIMQSNIRPFAFAFFLALMFSLPLNNIVVSILLIVAVGLKSFSITDVYVAINYIVVGAITISILAKLNKKINRVALGVIYVLGSGMFLYFNIASKNIIPAIVGVLLGLVVVYACYYFINATIVRGFNFKLNIDEIICGSVFMAVLAMGISAIKFYDIEFIKVFAVICVLSATYLFPSYTSLYVGAIIGVGASAYTGNVGFISAFVLYGLVSSAFKSNNRLYSVISILLVEILLGLYFHTYESFGIISVSSVVVAEIIFMLLPSSWVNRISDLIGGTKDKVAIRNIVNHSKEGLYKRMTEIAQVFGDMDTVFRNMVKGVLPEADAKKMLVSEVIEKCCKDSPEIARLLRTDSKMTTEVFENIINIGFERGKVTLLDIPQYLTTRIGKINYLINLINQLLTSYKHYSSMVNNMDASRVLIAEQLSGVSSILKNLAEEVKLNITFDLGKENRIVEELTYKGIYCLEAIVYEQTSHIINTTLVVKDADVNNSVIEKVVSKVVGSMVKVASSTPSSIPNCTVLVLKTAPKYDIIFGSASVSKNGEVLSGDTHSLIKIDDSKFMVALCDGMGSGSKANLTSTLSISLIENFYKAGFSSEIVLNSVNKLLSLNEQENFSALDVCIIDVRSNLCDFIKLGSPYGFIKHNNSTEVVQTSGLPIGVLEEMKPHIVKKVMQNFDTVLLVSDGVSDAFESVESMSLFINNISSTNPQTIADEVLDRALDNMGGISADDMTVVAVRIYPLI